MVVMVQKEVAETIAAEAGQRACSALPYSFTANRKSLKSCRRLFLSAAGSGFGNSQDRCLSATSVDVADVEVFSNWCAPDLPPPQAGYQFIDAGAGFIPRKLPVAGKGGYRPSPAGGTFTLEEWTNLWRIFSQDDVEGEK